MTKHIATGGLLLLLSGVVALAMAAPGSQEVLTPALYFDCQIAARQATITGLEERAAQAAKPGLTDAERRLAGEVARQRVSLAMHNCGRQDAATLGAYAHRHAEQLQAWLNANAPVKARLDAQRQRVASLASQMPAVAPPAQR